MKIYKYYKNLIDTKITLVQRLYIEWLTEYINSFNNF